MKKILVALLVAVLVVVGAVTNSAPALAKAEQAVTPPCSCDPEGEGVGQAPFPVTAAGDDDIKFGNPLKRYNHSSGGTTVGTYTEADEDGNTKTTPPYLRITFFADGTYEI